MRRYDLSPLYRSTVGFDKLFTLLDGAMETAGTSYPPYNIEKTGETSYRISVAVAGFTEADLNVEVKEHSLLITGNKAQADGEAERAYLHRGIAERAFNLRFQLADHVEVQGADLKDGLLHVSLERVVPESLKPRRIEIAKGEKLIGQSA